MFGLPALLIGSALQATPGPTRVERARWAVVICLIAEAWGFAHVLAMAIFMFSPHDAIPWAEAVGGGVLIVAAACLWLTVQRDKASDTEERGDVGAPLVTT
jgi:hypothetical protein